MKSSLAGALALGVLMFVNGSAMAEAPGDPKAVKSTDGKYFDAKGDPTYNVGADGTVDWYTFSGYRRYHAECHVCHGPNGGGSTYAPALKDSVKRFNYAEFAGIVIGRQDGSRVGSPLGVIAGGRPISERRVIRRFGWTEAMGAAPPERREPLAPHRRNE